MSTTAFIVLGIQTGIGTTNDEVYKAFIKSVYRYTIHLRRYKIPIFFTALWYYPGFPELSAENPTYAYINGDQRFSQPFQLRLLTFDGDVIVKTVRLDAFIGSTLDVSLRAKGIKRLVFCGSDIEGMIFSTITHANALDYDCVVLKDLCLFRDPEGHRSLLQNVLRIYARITTSWDFTNELFETYGPPRGVMTLPPDMLIPRKPATSQPKPKPKGNQNEDFRKAAILNAANSIDEPTEGAPMAQEASSIQKPPQPESDNGSKYGHSGQFRGTDAEQPVTGYLRKTKEQDEHEVQIKNEESPDENDESSPILPPKSPRPARAVLPRQQLQESLLNKPAEPRTGSFCGERRMTDDPVETATPPNSPRPATRTFTSATTMLSPGDYILSCDPRRRDRALAGLEQVRRPTQEEWFETSPGKRSYNNSFLSWQPITHADVMPRSFSGRPEDERFFRRLDGSDDDDDGDDEEPAPKRRKSDETDDQDQFAKAKDVPMAFRPKAPAGEKPEMQPPENFLATALKEKMKAGGLKSHLPDALDRKPEVKPPELPQSSRSRFRSPSLREANAARRSTPNKVAEKKCPRRLSDLDPDDI